jgi:hypothetical protein
MGTLSSGGTASLLRSNLWIMGCTWQQSLHVLPYSNSAMKGNNGTKRIPRHCWPNRHKISHMFHCLLHEYYPNVKFPGVENSVKNVISDHITTTTTGFMAVTPPFMSMRLSITFS